MRGLDGRAVRSYPSTEAVLEAVATGRERAGYVIVDARPLAGPRALARASSTFLPAGPDRPTVFPIVRGGAQVGPRPEGRDRPGLGRARAVGPARPVFARWHIPYDRRPRPDAAGIEGRRHERDGTRRVDWVGPGVVVVGCSGSRPPGRMAAPAAPAAGTEAVARTRRPWRRARPCSAGSAAAVTAGPAAAARGPT